MKQMTVIVDVRRVASTDTHVLVRVTVPDDWTPTVNVDAQHYWERQTWIPVPDELVIVREEQL